MTNLAAQLRRLHPLAVAGRPANYDLILSAAAELDRLTAANDGLRDELAALHNLIATNIEESS